MFSQQRSCCSWKIALKEKRRGCGCLVRSRVPAAQLKYKNTHANVILLLNTNIYLNTCMTQLNSGDSKTNDVMNEHIS